MDKRVVDSGRVGEKVKEALVDGLDGLSMMLVWELFFSASVLVGQWEWRKGVCPEKEAKGLDRCQICWNKSAGIRGNETVIFEYQ